MARGDLPPGITRRHARSCPARRTDDLDVCRCRPSYQAQAGPRRGRQTKTWPTLAAAKSWKRDVDQAHERGELTVARAPKLRDAADDWLDKAARGVILAKGDKPYRPSTLRGYRQLLDGEMLEPLMDVRLDLLTRGRLNEYVQGLQARGMAAQTVKNHLVPVRAICRNAFDLEQIKANPTRGVKVPAGSGRRMRFLAPAEIPAYLARLDERDRALWAIAVYAGLRRGELMALTWADVDLAASRITVRHSYDAPSQTTGRVKSEAGEDRLVPIVASLHDHLAEHRQQAGPRPRGLVFARARLAGHCRAASREMPFNAQTVTERARRRWNTSGMLPVTLHDCRHTFASLMIAATAAAGTFNPKTIQQLLGHASIVQTYDRYGHLFPGAEAEAGRLLDRFLASWPQDPAALPTITDAHEGVRDRPVTVQRTRP